MAVKMSSTPVLTVDPACPLATLIMTCSAVRSDAIIRGANRWFDVLSNNPYLLQNAKLSGCLTPSASKLPDKPTGNSLWESSGYRPISFSSCAGEVDTLFIACVWIEATACEDCTSWHKRYSKKELGSWVQRWKAGETRWAEIEWAIQIAKGSDYKPKFIFPKDSQ